MSAESEALFDAVSRGDRERLRSAIAAGADPNAVSKYGSSLLYSACFADQTGALEALLAAGADPNLRMTYRSPVDGRVEVGLVALMVCRSSVAVAILLGAGAQPNVSDIHGSTPLMRAALAAGAEAVELLIRAGADPRAEDAHGKTAADRVRARLSWLDEHASTLRQSMASERRKDLQAVLALLGP